MKNVIILSLVFFCTGLIACSQKNVPDNVKKEFSLKFAGATSVKWGSEEANEWEAEFKLNGKEVSACFDNTGKWTTTETIISEKELPAPVVSTINTQFPGFKKTLIEIFDSPEMKGFEIGLKKGKTALEVILDKEGKILKKSDLKEESEKDEKK
jgi:hypothetical protein